MFGRPRRCATPTTRAWARCPFEDVIAYSRNVGHRQVAHGAGRRTPKAASVLYSMWTRLGFGGPTGVDIASEAAGIASDPAVMPWAAIDLANRAFGQAVAVTPLQLADGLLARWSTAAGCVQPHVVESVDGQATRRRAASRCSTPEVARQLRELMVHVGDQRRSAATPRALIPGYVGRRQDRHRPDLGRAAEASGSQRRLQLQLRAASSAATIARGCHRSCASNEPSRRSERKGGSTCEVELRIDALPAHRASSRSPVDWTCRRAGRRRLVHRPRAGVSSTSDRSQRAATCVAGRLATGDAGA